MRPTRATVEGRVSLDLQNQARRDARPTDELLAPYALEGFLARLATSPESDRLVLKGGSCSPPSTHDDRPGTSTCKPATSAATSSPSSPWFGVSPRSTSRMGCTSRPTG